MLAPAARSGRLDNVHVDKPEALILDRPRLTWRAVLHIININSFYNYQTPPVAAPRWHTAETVLSRKSQRGSNSSNPADLAKFAEQRQRNFFAAKQAAGDGERVKKVESGVAACFRCAVNAFTAAMWPVRFAELVFGQREKSKRIKSKIFELGASS